MIVFTVIGYFCALCAMFELGQWLAIYIDARRGIKRLMEPIDTHMKELRLAMSWLAIVSEEPKNG